MLKDFKKFCISTIKNSFYLMAKYIFAGIFFIVLTVFANKLDLNSLTYFNAILSILFFSEMFGFGICNCISVYINQNIDKKDKILGFVKSGFNVSLLVSIVFILIIILFKDFIFRHIIIVNINDNYLFLYIMIPVFFLNIINYYFENILKSLKEFKNQFILNILKNGIIFIGIIFISIFFKLNIYQIGFLYLLSYIIQLIYLGYLYKYKTKKITFNFLNIFKIKSEKDKTFLKKIFIYSFIEIIGGAGYTLSALFLLKKGEQIYNSYCYFENVLDIVNGFYFALLSVASISICNSLGKNNKDEAYKNSIFILIFICLIWGCYCIGYILLKPLFISGMNVEIIKTASNISYMYLLIHLFRFIDWALNSYIINQGGETKVSLITNIFGICYFILLFIFADYIPNNNLLLIFLVGFDSLVKLIVGLIYFFSKKWMVNITK